MTKWAPIWSPNLVKIPIWSTHLVNQQYAPIWSSNLVKSNLVIIDQIDPHLVNQFGQTSNLVNPIWSNPGAYQFGHPLYIRPSTNPIWSNPGAYQFGHPLYTRPSTTLIRSGTPGILSIIT
jgi:hypothetical protein